MKKTAVFVFAILVLSGFYLQGNSDVPVAISPGMAGGVGVVKDSCPTFSWSGVAWAQKYRVVVFGVAVDGKKINDQVSLTAKPILSEDIAGGGLSWTPSASRGLAAGSDYSWYIGAMDAGGTWAWSEPRRFRVEESSKLVVNEGDKDDSRQVNNEKSLRTAAHLTEAKAAGKESMSYIPEGPMGSEGTYSTFYGIGAGANNSADANANSFFGGKAGNLTTDGYSNTFIGSLTGESNTSGYNNTAVGFDSGDKNTTGYHNTFLGSCAGVFNITGARNTYIGCYAGSESTGSGNVFIGANAGEVEMGSNKLYIDNSSNSMPLVYGDFAADKVGIFGWLGVGTKNPAYPMELKTWERAATFVASRDGGASNFINATTDYGQFGTVNNYPVRILVNSSWRMVLNADNSLNMVSGARCTAGGVWTNASSLALKQDVAPLNAETAAAALRELIPVTYAYKADASEKYVGFIAEEVPELVAMNDRKSLSPMDIVAVLTKVLQEQQKEIMFLKTKLSALEKTVADNK